MIVPEIITGNFFAARLFAVLGDRVERSLGIQRIEDGFDQQKIRTTFEQRRRLFGARRLSVRRR